MITLEEAYRIRAERETKGADNFYRPMKSVARGLLRADYRSRLLMRENGNPNVGLYTAAGNKVASGYTRVVVGDYGAYAEFSRDQLNWSIIRNKWPRSNKIPTYWWLVTTDGSHTKVYEQNRRVSYADYKPGMFYIAPDELYAYNGVCGYRKK